MRVGSEFQAGRQALLRGDNEAAVSYFQSVAAKDPRYVYGTALEQNVWSYLGKAEHAAGRFSEARTALQKSLLMEQNNSDIARLYLGLAMARSGERERGLSEIARGMKGIHEWLDYITEAHRFSFGQFWDPRREIRSAIEADLAMLSGKELDWQRLIANGERLGMRMEEEADRARRDERADIDRDGEDNRP
jgi:tetratricopeptide (TPR) repeat protein